MNTPNDIDPSILHFYAIVMDGGEVAGRFAMGPALGPFNEICKLNPKLIYLPPDKRGPNSGWTYDETSGEFSPPQTPVEPNPFFIYNPPDDYEWTVAVVHDGIVQFLWAIPSVWEERIKAALISNPMLVPMYNDGLHPPVDYGWTYDGKVFWAPEEVVVEVE